MEPLNGTKEVDALAGKVTEIECNMPLRLIPKINRLKRLLTPKFDRELIKYEAVNNASIMMSEVLKSLIAMNSVDKNILTNNMKEKLTSIYQLLTAMLETKLEEFDQSQLKDAISLITIITTELKLLVGRWYIANKFDNEDGSFDAVLQDIIQCCFANAEYLE